MKVELRVNHWVFFNQGYIEPMGEGVLVQLHNPNLIAVYPGKWTPHLKYSTYVPKKASTKILTLFDTAILSGRRSFVSPLNHKTSRNDASRRMIIR